MLRQWRHWLQAAADRYRYRHARQPRAATSRRTAPSGHAVTGYATSYCYSPPRQALGGRCRYSLRSSYITSALVPAAGSSAAAYGDRGYIPWPGVSQVSAGALAA